jgi:hypothetical protein
MKIHEALLAGKSGTNCSIVVQLVLNDSSRIEELMECFFSRNTTLSQRSAIPVGIIASKDSSLVLPFMKKMLSIANVPYNSGIRRNIVRTWQFLDIPEKYRGEVLDQCFKYVNDRKEAIAVRAFSLAICSQMCEYYPELKEELLLTIELHQEHGGPGFKSISKKVRKKLTASF